eukprot:scaffold348_cov329-Pavlova_lutheri.AAC.2
MLKPSASTGSEGNPAPNQMGRDPGSPLGLKEVEGRGQGRPHQQPIRRKGGRQPTRDERQAVPLQWKGDGKKGSE